MSMRTIKSLATELGYTERTFHRKLDSGDAKARLALRQEVIEDNPGVQQFPGDLAELAEIFERCDPEIARVAMLLSDRLEQLLESTPRSAWRMRMDSQMLECCDDDAKYAALEEELARETSSR